MVMGAVLRRHVPTILVAFATALVTAGGPALAGAVVDAVNADKVDGRHAVRSTKSTAKRAGKLVATNRNGVLPNNIIRKAPNANKLDGIDSGAFLRSTGKAADADKLDNLDAAAFLRADGKAVDSALLDGLEASAFATKQDPTGLLTETALFVNNVGTDDVAVITQPVTVGDECGARATTHRYLAQASGYASASGGTGTIMPRVSISQDSSMYFGPGFLIGSAPVVNFEGYVPLSPVRVLSLPEGEHTISVIGDFYRVADGTTTGTFDLWTLVIQDLGYTCA